MVFQKYQNSQSSEVVEAVQLTWENVEAVAAWCKGMRVEEKDPFTNQIYVGVNVPTIEGRKRASDHDWVVKAPADEDHAEDYFYPWKPGAFTDAFVVIDE